MMGWLGWCVTAAMAVVFTVHIRSLIGRGLHPNPPARLTSLWLWGLTLAALSSSCRTGHLLWLAPVSAAAAWLLCWTPPLRLLDPVTLAFAGLSAVDLITDPVSAAPGDLFNIFRAIRICALIVGSAGGLGAGARLLGPWGAVLGFAVGAGVGLWAGRRCELIGMGEVVKEIMTSSSEQLRASLRSPDCMTPNLVLLELKSRGEDVRNELPVVVGLLTSEDIPTRGRGWAALNSAFPELVEKVADYRLNDSADECRRKASVLLA